MTLTPILPRAIAVDLVDELLAFGRGRLAKASLPDAIALRDALVEPFADDLGDYFGAMADRVLGPISKAMPISWNPVDDVDWTVEEAELETVLARWYTTMGEEAFAAVSDQLAIELRFDIGDRAVAGIRDRIGTQVRGIAEASRAVLVDQVALATDRGYSIEQLVRGVDTFPGLRGLFDSWSSTRATTIALTETANAYNLASLAGYASSGLVETVDVYDGPDCGWTSHDDADLAAGSIRTLVEAAARPISHPRCQRAFGPVVIR